MKKMGIDARPAIAHQLHRYFGSSDTNYPNALRVDNELISLPIHNMLTEDNVKNIIYSIETFE